MDPQSPQRPILPVEEEAEDEWDNDGFVIPSFGIEEADRSGDIDALVTEPSKPPSPNKAKVEEKIYLGPHGAPREPASASTRKQRFKQKLKEADRRTRGGAGRENKLENLRELVGGKTSAATAKGSSRDWLDPHCHESQFDKWHSNP